jgi:hypothetical protein
MASAGYGRSLPATMGKGQEDKGPRFYGDLLTSPFGDQLTLDFARAALSGEQLGQDRTPDILAISGIPSAMTRDGPRGPSGVIARPPTFNWRSPSRSALDPPLAASPLSLLAEDPRIAGKPCWARAWARN